VNKFEKTRLNLVIILNWLIKRWWFSRKLFWIPSSVSLIEVFVLLTRSKGVWEPQIIVFGVACAFFALIGTRWDWPGEKTT